MFAFATDVPLEPTELFMSVAAHVLFALYANVMSHAAWHKDSAEAISLIQLKTDETLSN